MANFDANATVNLTGEMIRQVLEDRRFVVVEHSNSGDHVLLRRDHTDVVIPGPDRQVPSRVALMIQSSLEKVLGPGWLLDPGSADRSVTSPALDDQGSNEQDVITLDVIVMAPESDGPWRAFVAQEPSVIGYADDRNDALLDLKSAASLWMGVARERIVLVTPEVI